MALSFSIKLTDEVSPAANKAAGGLERLESAIKQESGALRQLETQMRAIQKGSVVDLDTARKLSSAIDLQKNKVAGLTQEMVKSGGAGFSSTKGNAAALEAVMGKLAKQGGVVGDVLGKIGPEGLAAAAGLGAATVAAAGLAAGLLATAGAVVYLGSKLVEMGIQASEAKGDVTRSLEILYGGEKAAEHTYKVLESLTGSIAISQGRVTELADTLIKAGQVNGDAMVKSIAAIGKAEAARAGAGKVLEGVITRATSARIFSISRAELAQVGISYRDLSKELAKGLGTTTAEAELRLRTGGVRVKAGIDALAKVVDTKMGDLANKKFQTVGAQTQRLHDSFTRLFEGVDSGPFARVLMSIANTLDESTVSGAALRAVVKSAFDEISAAAERVAPYLELFFKGAILLALKLYNALYPVRQSIAKLFGDSDAKGLQSTEDTLVNFATNVGEGFKVAALAIAWMIDNSKALANVVETLITLTPGIGPAFEAARATIKLITSDLGAGKDKTEGAGKKVADGVAQGITNGTPAVEAAMTAMAAKGTAAFDKKMGIQSPSKVMQIRGRYIDQGAAKGVNDNADAPAAAVAKMGQETGAAYGRAEPGSVGPAGAAGRAGANAPAAAVTGRSADGIVVHVTFQSGAIQGATNTQEVKDQLTELMADVFQRAAALRGA